MYARIRQLREAIDNLSCEGEVVLCTPGLVTVYDSIDEFVKKINWIPENLIEKLKKDGELDKIGEDYSITIINF